MLFTLSVARITLQVLVEENLDLNEHSKIAENHFVMAMAKKHFIAWNNVLRQVLD